MGHRDRAGHRHGRRLLILVGAVVLVLVVGAVTGGLVYRQPHRPVSGSTTIDASSADDRDAGWPSRTPRSPAPSGDAPPYVTSASADGHYLVDQYGRPMLVRGDSPWSLMIDLSPDQSDLYFSTRSDQGFNAAIVSLLGAVGNGGPSDDGSTYDGLQPFIDGDVGRWRTPYWERVRSYVQDAARHGITLMLYPVDAWVLGTSFEPDDIEQCATYGAKVARWFADAPNIVWMTGGDYIPTTTDPRQPSDTDACLNQLVRGIRSTGDDRLFSIQLQSDVGAATNSTDYSYWEGRVDWNFTYTYGPTYAAVLRATATHPEIPDLLGESNYEGENNQGNQPTTDQTLRRQLLWAVTSGAIGDFYGTGDWKFEPGWEDRLDQPGGRQVSRLRDIIAGLDWWTLRPDRPDAPRALVTGGRGAPMSDAGLHTDVLDSDYVTAARSQDGRLALVYVPTSRTFTIDITRLAPGTTARWVDPSDGHQIPVGVRTSYTPPGMNAEGDRDWLLVFSDPADRPAR